MSVAGDLRAEFERSGPIRFDRYMEVSLYGSGGFFSAATGRVGLRGDFVTSVELGPVFGTVLARRLLEQHDPIRVADVGGGRGTLAAQLMSAGDGAIEALSVDPAVAGAGAPAPRSSLEDLPWPPDVVVAHELLDNLPSRLLYRGEAELRVGFDEVGSTCLYHVPLDDELAAFAQRWVPRDVTGVTPVPVAALGWIAEVVALGPELVVVVDYGGDAATLGARPDWPVRGYVDQREVDPIVAPGETDVTCDVAFDVVEAEFQRHGYVTERLRQRDWLARHGIDDVVAATEQPEGPAAHAPAALAQLHAAEVRTQAAELTDPSGLGAFWVLEAHLRSSEG